MIILQRVVIAGSPTVRLDRENPQVNRGFMLRAL